RQASSKGRSLTIPSITEIQGQWFRMMDQLTSWVSEPVFLDAGAGSYVVRFEIQGSKKEHADLRAAWAELRDVAGLLAESRLRRVDAKESKKNLQSMRSVLDLLTSLTEANVVLEVTTQTGLEEVESFELRPPTRKELQSWQDTASRRIPSGDVPQAD